MISNISTLKSLGSLLLGKASQFVSVLVLVQSIISIYDMKKI